MSKEFDIKNGKWSEYVKLLEEHFEANKIHPEMRLLTLLKLVGNPVYILLLRLVRPRKISSLSYEEAIDILKDNLEPKSSILAARYKFKQRIQQPGESVTNYANILKMLSKECEFKDNTYENLRDQFIYGLQNEDIRKQIFEEDNIDFDNTLSKAITLEADKDTIEIKAGRCANEKINLGGNKYLKRAAVKSIDAWVAKKNKNSSRGRQRSITVGRNYSDE